MSLTLCSKWITDNFKGQIEELKGKEPTTHSEVLDQRIEAWLWTPEKLERRKLAKIVRNGVSCIDRIKLWFTEGKNAAGRILYLLSYVHSDISFSPLIPQLVYIFLHFMDEHQCFTSMHSLIESKRALGSKSKCSLSSCKDFSGCIEDFLRYFKFIHKIFVHEDKKPAFRCLQDALTSDPSEVILFLPFWTSWIFKYLDLWTLIVLVDSFIVEGPKVLYRAGLITVSHLCKQIEKKRTYENLEMEDLMQQCILQSKLNGKAFMKAAFGIRGLSRKILKKCKLHNIELLNAGKLPLIEVEIQDVLAVHSVKDSHILSIQQWRQLNAWLPSSVRICKAECIFSTERDGCSIKTLYMKCEDEDKTILLIKTSQKEVIGAFLTAPWSERFAGKRKNLEFFGTGESFVFTLRPEAEMYGWAGKQDEDSSEMFMAGDNQCLIIGGGGGQAIWLDEELNQGRSQSCSTFKNTPLTQLSGGDFQCLIVEVISFKT